MVFANGDRYEGDFFNNAKNGNGIHIFASKDRYEGAALWTNDGRLAQAGHGLARNVITAL